MENNQANTMNLGNNLGGVTPPVFGGINNISNANIPQQQPSTAQQVVVNQQAQQNIAGNGFGTNATVAPVQPAYSPATGTPNAQAPIGDLTEAELNVQETVVPQATEVTEETRTPVVLTDEITIPTVLLREMVASARKVGVSNNMQPLSEVLNLIIDENGITIRTTSGRGKQDFECVDRGYISPNKKLETSIDIRIFGEYLNAEKNSIITLDFVANENTLYVKTDTGMRKFAQRMDGSTHQPVVNELHFVVPENEMKLVNYENLVKILRANSSARDLATKSMYEYLKGMYCLEEFVVSSDGNIMVLEANQTEFNDKIFFINNDLCKLITDLPFIAKDFKVGFTYANGEPVGMTITDGRITICGPIGLQDKFPVEVANSFWKTDEFIQQVTVMTKEAVDVLKSVLPFVPTMGDDTDKVSISIQGDKIEFKCLDGSAVETMTITNNTNFNTTAPLSLPISKLCKLLETINSDSFDLLISTQTNNYVCVAYGNLKSIITTLN